MRALLDRANEDRTGELWISLADVMPLLAEASPDVFLDAVERALATVREPLPGESEAGAPPILGALFDDGGGSPFARAAHTGLLWALENLAWEPNYLGRAATILARSTTFTLSAQAGNRPERTLRQLFLLWDPQTRASFDERLAVLDALRTRHPQVAWQLLPGLLPQLHDVSVPNHSPRWRDWKPDRVSATPSPDPSELAAGEREIARRIVQDVGADPQRWARLLTEIERLPGEEQDAAIELLRTFDSPALDIADKTAIWNTIRSVVGRHRNYGDAVWALDAERVNRLEAAAGCFEPDDQVAKSAWLFEGYPDLPGIARTDVAGYQQALDDAQAVALAAVFRQGGLTDLLRLVVSVPQFASGAVGWMAGRTLEVHDEAAIVALLDSVGDSGDVRPAAFAAGFVRGRFAVRGWDWALPHVDAGSGLTTEGRAAFLGSLPVCERTWDLVQAAGADTVRAYWSRIRALPLEDPRSRARAAGNLIAAGRPHAALELLDSYADQDGAEGTAELELEALEQGAAAPLPTDGSFSMLSYHVAKVLDRLTESGVLEEARLARMEWAYLPLFAGRQREPRLLSRWLAHDAAFFVELVSWVYRGEHEDEAQTADDSGRATLALHLLRSWRRLPGELDGGGVDEEALTAWVTRARELLIARGRKDIGDQCIGQAMHNAPPGGDGIWPHEAIRNLIERTASDDLDQGLVVGVRNARGVTTRGVTDGGMQERALAERYSASAKSLAARWPRTAAVLRRIARSYALDAKTQDEDAELTEDLWR